MLKELFVLPTNPQGGEMQLQICLFLGTLAATVTSSQVVPGIHQQRQL